MLSANRSLTSSSGQGDVDLGGCCGCSLATPCLFLGFYVDYAQEVSVGREHDLHDLRVVAWVRECGEDERTCSSKKELNAAESISEILQKIEETTVCTFRSPRGQS